LQKEQQTLLLLYNCSHVLCVILPRQRRASSVRISLVIVNEEEEQQQQTVVVVSLFVVVVNDDAQKRSPIAPSLRKEKCIIYSEGTRSRTTIAAQTTRTSFFFVASSALSQGVLSRGDCLECNKSPKNKLTKKTFCSFPNNQKQARGEHSQNRAIADDTPVLGLSSNNKDSTSSSSSEERERLVAEILENVDDGGARFRERE
jgi:acyl-CoA hydrolase